VTLRQDRTGDFPADDSSTAHTAAHDGSAIPRPPMLVCRIAFFPPLFLLIEQIVRNKRGTAEQHSGLSFQAGNRRGCLIAVVS
jgi:hypothetical protein